MLSAAPFVDLLLLVVLSFAAVHFQALLAGLQFLICTAIFREPSFVVMPPKCFVRPFSVAAIFLVQLGTCQLLSVFVMLLTSVQLLLLPTQLAVGRLHVSRLVLGLPIKLVVGPILLTSLLTKLVLVALWRVRAAVQCLVSRLLLVLTAPLVGFLLSAFLPSLC
jgi:hypothetical protein